MDKLSNSPSLALGSIAGQLIFGRTSLSLFFSLLGFHLVSGHAAQPYTLSEIQAVEKPVESKIRELRDQEVNQLRITLGRRQAKNRMGELYYRLAEIYLESYRAAFILEGRAHEERLLRGESDKTIQRGYSRPFLAKGIQASKEILSNGIAYQKLDRVYYFLAFNYGELGQYKESVRYHELITQKFPESPFIGESYRELGDFYFEGKQYRKAQAYFEQAIKRSDESNRARLLHKLAWTHYRIKNYDAAVDSMKQAIEASSRSGEKFISLKDEALKDLAIFMTESGRVDEAVQYFQKVAQDRTFYPKALERLGNQYERSVEPLKAMQVYEALLKTAPDSDAAFRTQVKLVDLDLRQKKISLALGRLKQIEILKGYESSDQETQVAAQNLKAMIRRTATESHDRFRKKSDKRELIVAEAAYAEYLNSVLARLVKSSEMKEKVAPEISEIKMYLAEVKRELGQSQEASELYRQVLESRDKRYAKEAGALWTASLAEAIKKAGPPQTKFANPSQLETDFVAAADQLQDTLGETPEGRDAALRSAQVLAGYKNTQNDAIKRSKTLIKQKPRSPQAVMAARLWLQIESDRYSQAGAKDDDDLKDTIEDLRGNPELMAADSELSAGKLRSAILDEETRLKIKLITKNENNEDFKDAALGYEQLAVSTSNRELSDRAFQNSVNSYVKASDSANAERVLFAWSQKFPQVLNATNGQSKDSRALTLGRTVATHYLITGEFQVAIKLFERFGREWGDLASLETAAKVSDGVGERPRALKLFIETTERTKDRSADSRFWALNLEIAKMIETQGDDHLALKYYLICAEGLVAGSNGGSSAGLNSGSNEILAEAQVKIGDLHLRRKDLNQAKNYFRKVAGQSPVSAHSGVAGKQGTSKSPKSRNSQVSKMASASFSPYVGYARFKLAEMQEKEVSFEKMALPEEQLKRALNARLQHLETMSRAYGFAQEAGGPWAVAAIDKFSTWAELFANEIDQIAPPPAASPEGVAKFKSQLKTISQPIRAKALSNRLEVYRQATDAEVMSPVVPVIGDRLADLRISQVNRAQGVRGKFRLAGVGADEGADSLKKVRERLLKSSAESQGWVDYGNLLWGTERPLLARIAYDRALQLNPRNTAALNNKAVILLSGGEEDWLLAYEGNQYLIQAISQDPLFIPAKANRAFLLNYYRSFIKAKPLWEQVLVKSPEVPEFLDGLAISIQGMGQPVSAEAEFLKAQEKGAKKSRFANAFHSASRSFHQAGGLPGKTHDKGKTLGFLEKCVDALEDMDRDQLSGFERTSGDHLLQLCKRESELEKK